MKPKTLPVMLIAFFVLSAIAVAQNARVALTGSANEQEQKPSYSKLHVYFTWAKERLDEMDATLALWESKTAELRGNARANAESALADMRAARDSFREAIKNEAEMNEADWARAKDALEARWTAFEASVRKYIDETGAQVDQQKAVFRARADAQRKAWHEAMDNLDGSAAGVAAENRAKVESAIKRMKADSNAAEAKLNKLKYEGAQSWPAFEKALAETRADFDRVNQTARDAFGKPASSKSDKATGEQLARGRDLVQRVLNYWDFKTWNQLLAKDVTVTFKLGTIAPDSQDGLTALGEVVEVQGRDEAKPVLRQLYGNLKKNIKFTGQFAYGYEVILLGELDVTPTNNVSQSLPIACFMKFDSEGKIDELSLVGIDAQRLFDVAGNTLDTKE